MQAAVVASTECALDTNDIKAAQYVGMVMQVSALHSPPCCSDMSGQTMCVSCTPLACQVLYEDDYVIAVSKPPGLITAPKHRHVVRHSPNVLVQVLCQNPPYLQ